MRTNEEIVNLIDELRKEKDLSLSELARRVDMPKSTLSRYLNKSRQFPLDRANEFANILGVSAEYILGVFPTDITSIYNQLEKERQRNVLEFAKNQLDKQKNSKTINDNIVNIVEYRDLEIQSKVSAGTGILDLDPDHKDSVRYKGYIPAEFDLAFQISGDSMEPMFKDNEIVFVTCDQEVRNGQIGIVQINQEAFIKKMYVENNCLRLVSLNSNYEDVIATQSDEIKIIGRIII